MKKNFKVSELCNILGICTQYFYNMIKKPQKGVVYDENFINYDELKKYINNKFVDDEIKRILIELDIESLDDIVIIKGSKNQNCNVSKVNIDDLEIDSKYILRSYHYENKYILRNIIELDDEELYIFENLNESKTNKDKFRALSKSELENERFTIKELEEE